MPPFLQGCAWHLSVSEKRDTDMRLHGRRPGASCAPDFSLPCPHSAHRACRAPAAFTAQVLRPLGLHRSEGAGFMEPPPYSGSDAGLGSAPCTPPSMPLGPHPHLPPPSTSRVCGRQGGGSWLAVVSCTLSASGGLEASISINCRPCGHQSQQGPKRAGSTQPDPSTGRGVAGQGDRAGALELSGSGWPTEGWDRLTPLTVGAFMPWAADAQVPGDAVLAGAPVQARLGSALVDF